MFVRKPSVTRKISFLLLFCFTFQIFFPTRSLALTSGPSQPEFSGFESVSTSEMVDAFSGDFTYNLPLLTVPGPQGSSYPISLSYHSGAVPEEDASWVGFGWSLNPGAINRNMRGIPDDDNGTPITYWNKMPPNWTVSASAGVSIEGFSKEFPIGAEVDLGIRYNNYNGFGYNRFVGIKGGLIKDGVLNMNLGLSESETGRSYMVGISPFRNLAGSLSLSLNESPDGITYGASYNTFTALTRYLQSKTENEYRRGQVSRLTGGSYSLGGNHGFISYSDMVRPLAVTPYNGFSIDVKVGSEFDIGAPVGLEGRISGSYTGMKNQESRAPQSFGYLYASEAGKFTDQVIKQNQAGLIQDYYTEKETSYIKRDKFLGMAFNNADNFSVSGEGVGGGFRLYHKQIGQFTPTYSQSRVTTVNGGADIHVGTGFGLGGTADGSVMTTTEQAWDSGVGGSGFSSAGEENGVFFRFNNDLGGKLDYQTSDNGPVKASIDVDRTRDRFTLINPAPSAAVPQPLAQRNARSSFIGYTTNGDMVNHRGRSYSKRAVIDQPANRTNADLSTKIGEFSIYNTSGMQYLYALPVYSRNERHLQVGLKAGTQVVNNYLVYGIDDTDKENAIYQGQERISPADKPFQSAYASTFLLTQINTPDYVDRNYDGPDPSDPGGYTLFDYQKIYGNETQQWYKWRSPYNGLIYQRGTLSDRIDDRASVSEGEKEIYYLSAIRTKTHIAVFRTSPRLDGLDAPSGTQATSSAAKGSHTLLKLDRIDLYTLSDFNNNKKPIKSARFEYDYSLCKNLPNASDGAGKLTLKKVWFEYYGLQQSAGKISPYVFDYQYPNAAQFALYPAIYQNMGQDYTLPEGEQNPDFSYFQTDAWGYYQRDGASRFANMQPWVNQNPSSQFDPAAWQLKVIKLPSGGQIHVQYEQDEYSYVQDQPAHILSALAEPAGDRFYLSDQGLATDADRRQVRDLIDKHYVRGQNKMYFKFLYRLLGTATPGLDDCNAEYISGYASVREVGIANNRLFVRLGKGATGQELPHQVCSDFVQSQRVGKLDESGKCAGQGPVTNSQGPLSNSMIDTDYNSDDAFKRKGEGMVRQLIKMRKIKLGTNLCISLNPALSYLKIPVFAPKKGGGLRVKRLLTFDKGIDGEPVLYGNEYIYKAPDPNLNGTMRSSGVAINEPSAIREENSLVQLIERYKQSKGSKAISGVDKKQTEGPLGETLLPAPSVGYWRIIVQNIYKGKSNPGFAVKEFYTANQPVGTDTDQLPGVRSRQATTYAFRSEMTEIENKRIYLPTPGFLFNRYVNSAAMTQGFSFFINDMHGKPKREATYAGSYDPVEDLKNAVLVTEQSYQYYKPGEKVPVWNEASQTITLAELGTEVDVTNGQKAIEEEMNQVGVTGDVTVTLFGGFLPIVYAMILPTGTFVRNKTYVHTITKVIRQSCMLKRIRSYADGIYHTDEYLAFDPTTGQPVWSKSYDEFAYRLTSTQVPSTPANGTVVAANRTAGGAYAKQTIMAHWKYAGMGVKYQTEGKTIIGSANSSNASVTATYAGGFLTLAGPVADACQVLGELAPGDLIEIAFASGQSAYYNAGQADVLTRRVRIHPSRLSAGFVPADQTAVGKLTVVHSGRSNELMVPAGSTTYHAPDGNWETILTEANSGSTSLLSYQTRPTVKDAQGNQTPNPYAFRIPLKAVQPDLTGVQQLVTDLNDRYAGIGQSASGSFTLNGTYSGINISAYASRLSTVCDASQEAATISNVAFRYQQANGQITLQLASFDVHCQGNTQVTIRN